MGLKLLKQYVMERYGHKVLEVPNGFCVYGVQQLEAGTSVLFVQDFFVQKSDRGFTAKSSSRQLFNLLKKTAKKENCDSIAGYVQLDTYNGNDMLRLFLYLGFQVAQGNGVQLLMRYEVK